MEVFYCVWYGRFLTNNDDKYYQFSTNYTENWGKDGGKDTCLSVFVWVKAITDIKYMIYIWLLNSQIALLSSCSQLLWWWGQFYNQFAVQTIHTSFSNTHSAIYIFFNSWDDYQNLIFLRISGVYEIHGSEIMCAEPTLDNNHISVSTDPSSSWSPLATLNTPLMALTITNLSEFSYIWFVRITQWNSKSLFFLNFTSHQLLIAFIPSIIHVVIHFLIHIFIPPPFNPFSICSENTCRQHLWLQCLLQDNSHVTVLTLTPKFATKYHAFIIIFASP